MRLRVNVRPEKCWAGGRGEPQTGHRDALGPVQLDDPFRRHTPPGQVGADAERHQERCRPGPQQCPYGGQVQVVVVVVRDEDRVDRGQLVQRHRGRMQAVRPHQPGRRAPVAPHRIDQHPTALDLDQHRGVAVPDDAQLVGGAPRPGPSVVGRRPAGPDRRACAGVRRRRTGAGRCDRTRPSRSGCSPGCGSCRPRTAGRTAAGPPGRRRPGRPARPGCPATAHAAVASAARASAPPVRRRHLRRVAAARSISAGPTVSRRPTRHHLLACHGRPDRAGTIGRPDRWPLSGAGSAAVARPVRGPGEGCRVGAAGLTCRGLSRCPARHRDCWRL